MVTMKLWVLSGKPAQLSSGDWSWPPEMVMPLHWANGIVAPSATVLLASRKSETAGRPGVRLDQGCRFGRIEGSYWAATAPASGGCQAGMPKGDFSLPLVPLLPIDTG
jgi:hypothetical protein